ncbi:MAG: excinuclease ABC subunit C, partial [Clostridia bacterium]|nr:excinuclease ABC subunit C [Clostridia bacterium]
MGVLQDKLKLLPENPGVYVMLDKDGVIIYVGKAKNLKNRVRQYFFNSVKTRKVMAMVSNIADFYYIIAPSEIDALSLENNLIKKHKPRYNILLKDDKTYPYLRVDLKEPFPVFKVTRRIKKDGAKYFGPFMGGISVKSVLETLNLLYGIRPCDKKLNPEKTVKPCLNYHIAKCSSPCSGRISEKEYRDRVKSAIEFLSGDIADAERILTEKMTLFAQMEQFETAIKYKEALKGLEKLKLKRITALNKFLSADVIAYASNGIYSAVNILFIRNGRMLGSKNFSFESAAFSPEDAVSEFILRYYKKDGDIPDEIITATELAEEQTLSAYLKKVTGKDAQILFAKQGVRRQLIDMAEINANEHLETAIDKIKHKNDMTVSACAKLKEILNLKNFPHRMECYDISNISGV